MSELSKEQTARLRNLIEEAARVGQRAVERYGYAAQETMIVEECGELLTAIARVRRGRDSEHAVIEEAADVLIVVLQIGLNLGDNAFMDMIGEKIARLSTRIRS